MQQLINENTDIHGNVYRLWLDLKKSSLKDYVDVEFYSTYSCAKNPENKQTKWKTTLPKVAYKNLMVEFTTFHQFEM